MADIKLQPPQHSQVGGIQVDSFLHADTETFSHVVYQQAGGPALLFDPVLDYEAASGTIETQSAEQIVKHIQSLKLDLVWIIETHAHADHLTAAPFVQKQCGGQLAIGRPIDQVQKIFKPVFNLEPFAADGRQFDHLFQPGDQFTVGEMIVKVMAVPGHTPADMAYQVSDGKGLAVFVGDTIFMPDVGTARCDFPGGDAAQLYQSIQTLLALPDDTRLYLCHDYPPKERSHQASVTVGEQKIGNIHVREGTTQDAFVTMRHNRDATLSMPRLILPSIQVNIRAGQLPEPESNGERYLKIPLKLAGTP